VQSIYEQGGFIASFFGDAFAALFPAGRARALAAAWAIRQHMQAHPTYATPLGEFSLSVRIALAVGEVQWGILRPAGVALPCAYYFGGEAIEACAGLVPQAGELLLDRAAAKAMAAWCSGEAQGSGLRVRQVSEALPAPQASPPPDAGLVRWPAFCRRAFPNVNAGSLSKPPACQM
jgi:hypothetical protein